MVDEPMAPTVARAPQLGKVTTFEYAVTLTHESPQPRRTSQPHPQTPNRAGPPNRAPKPPTAPDLPTAPPNPQPRDIDDPLTAALCE